MTVEMAQRMKIVRLEQEERKKPLGLVWLWCPSSPMLALGLEKALGDKAYVHRKREAPASGDPSLVVVCPSSEEELAANVARVKGLVPDAPIVVLGMRAELPMARAALRAKTRGFVHAGMRPEQLARALWVAKRGEVVVPRELLVGLVGEEDRSEELTELTARQEEILELVDEGLSNAEIARRLYLSESTIKQHLRKVYQTLGVKNRNHAAGLFRRTKPKPLTIVGDTMR